MIEDKDDKPLVVLFIDALDSEELTGFLDDNYVNNIDVSEIPQMVTPSVLGRYLTGEDEGETGMIRPTHPFRDPINHPQSKTFLEDVEKKMMIYNVPMTKGIDIPEGMNAGSGAGGGFQDVFNLPNGNYNMIEDDIDRISNQIVDTTAAFFSTIRTGIRNGENDIYFISYRLIDTLTHFYHTDVRQEIIGFIEHEVKLTSEISNLLYFSDHGGQEKTETFYMNKWLEEKGYLSTSVLYDKLKRQNERQGSPTPDQVGPHSQLCQVDRDSEAVTYDAYDSSIDLIGDDASADDIIEELMSTGNFVWVKHKSELYDEDDPCYDILPEIIPKREEGVLVTGNVHRNAGPGAECQSEFRDGVHSSRACFGMNFDMSDYAVGMERKQIKPVDFHYILKNAMKGAPTVTREEEKELSGEEQQEIADRLAALGYL